jgi:ankyrin repeat protein
MLHYAASKGCVPVVQNLIDHGADAQLIDKYGYNPYGLSLREE